jgi:hypothetical protein
MTGIALWRGLAGSRKEALWERWGEADTTNRRRDKSGSPLACKPLLSRGFSRAGRSGAVPVAAISHGRSTTSPALSADRSAGGRR